MTLAFTPEQLALAETVDGVLARHCTGDVVRAAASDRRVSDGLWARLVELDIPALTVPEAAGGLGLGPVELVAVAEAAGRHAAPIPLVATIGAFVPVVASVGGDDPAALAVLERVAAGARATLAVDLEPGAAPAQVRGGTLSARIDGIPDAGQAELVAVVAQDEDGRPLVVVHGPEALGVRALDAMDPAAKVGRLEADGLPLSGAVLLPGDPGPGLALACTSAAAELVGLAAELVARSVAHAGERVQFGRPIGSFQAVKHQIVDAHVAVERARSLVRHAAVLAAAGDPEAPTAARLAKAAAGEAASGAARTGVQVHGGIGITEEHDVSRLYLRARQLSALLGGADGHYVAVARARLES